MTAPRIDLPGPRTPGPRAPADAAAVVAPAHGRSLIPGPLLGLAAFVAALGAVVLASYAMPAIALCAILLIEWVLG